MINIDFGLTESQMAALAIRWGYQLQIEDTTQPLEGDSHPLINNPEGVSEWMAPRVAEFVKGAVFERLRSDALVAIDNLHAKARDTIIRGQYDEIILSGENPIPQIISDLTS